MIKDALKEILKDHEYGYIFPYLSGAANGVDEAFTKPPLYLSHQEIQKILCEYWFIHVRHYAENYKDRLMDGEWGVYKGRRILERVNK